MVTHRRESLFGVIDDGEMQLNRFGEIVRRAWFDLPRHYPHVELGTFCIMPNHVHGIIILTDDRRGGSIEEDAGLQTVPPENHASFAKLSETRPYKKRHALPEIVRAFKSFSAVRINALRGTIGIPVWQRNYYEHIIRDDGEHNRIHLYIEANPVNWGIDEENPRGP